MNNEKFTNKSREALIAAQNRAIESGHQELSGLHLLNALVEQENGLLPSLLKRLQVDVPKLTIEINRELDKIPAVSGSGASQVYQSREFSQILIAAGKLAVEMKDEYVSVEHLTLGIIGTSGKAQSLLAAQGVDKERFLKALQEIRGNQRVTSEDPESERLFTASAVIAMLWKSVPTVILMIKSRKFDIMPATLAKLP